MTPIVKPLSYRHRYWFFYLLTGIFIAALPFLFLYASGYRFEFGREGLISTGGLYIAAERTGAQIYINDQLVRETRVFRRAFYAQGLPADTHKIHVDKDGHHTWVKELPVYAHLVTEAQAFNLPLVPNVRVITPWRTRSDIAVMTSTSSLLSTVSIVNQYLLEPKASTASMVRSSEFDELLGYFVATSTLDRTGGLIERMQTTLTDATSTDAVATTTKLSRNVQLFQDGDEVYARYVGPRGDMPYYYCAEPFPRYQPQVASSTAAGTGGLTKVAKAAEFNDELLLEVQTVEETAPCDPTVRIDRAGEEVTFFDFFPNSTDLVVIGSDSGIYLVEIDDRAWQNRQPLLKGEGLEAMVVNGNIYAYDGTYIYQVQIGQNWF